MVKPHHRMHWRWRNVVSAAIIALLLVANLQPFPVLADGTGPTADRLTEQPGGKTKWVVVGSFQGWINNSADTQMKHLVGNFYEYSTVLPAGHHEFKLVKSGSWDGFSDGGNNFAFDLTHLPKSISTLMKT